MFSRVNVNNSECHQGTIEKEKEQRPKEISSDDGATVSQNYLLLIYIKLVIYLFLHIS